MYKKILSVFFVAAVLFTPASSTFAQSKVLATPAFDPNNFLGGAQYCYVAKGKITLSFGQNSVKAVSGTTLTLSGNVKNKLSVPLADTSVVVKVVKLPKAGAVGYDTVQDVVQRFVATQHVDILENSSTEFRISWAVPHGIESGAYKLEAFLVLGDKSTIAGSETADIPAASVLVSVRGDASNATYIDKDSVRVDGLPLNAKGSATTSSATVGVSLVNTYSTSRDTVLEYKVYKSITPNDADLEYSGAQLVSLKANSKQVVNFDLKKGSASNRSVVIILKDGEKNSIVSFQAINPQGITAQPVFLGLSSFSLSNGGSTQAFGCVFLGTKDLKTTISLTDMNGAKLADLGSAPNQIGPVSFSNKVPVINRTGAVRLNMKVTDAQDKVISTMSVLYSCNANGCKQTNAAVPNIYMIIGLSLVIIVGIFAMIKMKGKNRKNIFGGIMALMMVLIPAHVFAQMGFPGSVTILYGDGFSGSSSGDSSTGYSPAVSLTASPTSVSSGSASTLYWTTTDTSQCTATGGWTGAKNVNGGSVSTGALTSDTSYTLSCTGLDGSTVQSSVTVTISSTTPPPSNPTPTPTVSLTASPANVDSGSATTVSWASANSTSCTASGAWGGAQATNGSVQTSSITSQSTFTLTCTGAGGSANSSVTVNMNAAPGDTAPVGALDTATCSVINGWAYDPDDFPSSSGGTGTVTGTGGGTGTVGDVAPPTTTTQTCTVNVNEPADALGINQHGGQGTRVLGNQASADYSCQLLGYDKAVNFTTKSFKSCSNNQLAYANGGAWAYGNACDLGNQGINWEQCSGTGSICQNKCGNGIIDPGEQCDGNSSLHENACGNPTWYCSTTCKIVGSNTSNAAMCP
jgi:hypothetical protein